MAPTASSVGDAQEMPYKPKDAIGATTKTTMIMTGAGLFISAIQNTLTKQNVGALGIFTKTGSTVAVYGIIPISLQQPYRPHLPPITMSSPSPPNNHLSPANLVRHRCNGSIIRIHKDSFSQSPTKG